MDMYLCIMVVLVFSRRLRKTKKTGRKWKKPWNHLDYRQTKCENTMRNEIKIVLIRINGN